MAHETARRIELEETQAGLLSRVKEMDAVVDEARGEVRTLSQECTVQRKEVIRAREELGKEQQKRLKAEKKTQQLSDDLGLYTFQTVLLICKLWWYTLRLTLSQFYFLDALW